VGGERVSPPDAVPSRDDGRDGFQEMELVGIRVEMPSDAPAALLKETSGSRYLPIWIDAAEATAIAFAHQGMVSLRPLTHELLHDVLAAVGIRLVSVNITALGDGTFNADLVLSNGSAVNARPADGIALAIRAGARILAADEILAQAEAPDDQLVRSASDRAADEATPAGTKEAPTVLRKQHDDLTVHDPGPSALIEMQLVGVRVEIPSNSPIVLLKETSGGRYLPIWIGAVEAAAIAAGQHGLVAQAPLTHDLFRDVLDAVNIRLLSVRVTSISAGIFYADLVLSNGSTVSARPSDAIALAVRTGATIEATAALLDGVGVEVPGDD
jgi:bifunctional DNase/RNase